MCSRNEFPRRWVSVHAMTKENSFAKDVWQIDLLESRVECYNRVINGLEMGGSSMMHRQQADAE